MMFSLRFTLVVVVIVFVILAGIHRHLSSGGHFFSALSRLCDRSAVLLRYRHWLYPFPVTRAVPLRCASHFSTHCADYCRWVARVSCGDRTREDARSRQWTFRVRYHFAGFLISPQNRSTGSLRSARFGIQDCELLGVSFASPLGCRARDRPARIPRGRSGKGYGRGL